MISGEELSQLVPTGVGLTEILYLQAACLLAYFLKGFTGFGPALVFIPSVTLLLDPKTALAGSAFIDLWVGAGLAATLDYGSGDAPLILRMAAAIALGTVLGGTVAGIAPEQIISLLIGIVVLVFGLRLLVVGRAETESLSVPGRKFLYGGCAAGGVSGALTGVSGPLVVIGARPLMDKTRLRRVLVAVFLLEGIVKLAVYGVVGVWSDSVFRLALVASPGILVGLAVGYHVHFSVSERGFNFVVGLILTALSIRVLWSVI